MNQILSLVPGKWFRGNGLSLVEKFCFLGVNFIIFIKI